MRMKIFTEKVGGKYCPSFKFGNQTFHLRGCDTKEDAVWFEDQLKACFSNYGLFISRKITDDLLKNSTQKLNELFEELKK